MHIYYTQDRSLGEAAHARIDFDMESIRQMLSAHREPTPTAWIVEPEGYESQGHVLRDSPSIRLLAYVAGSRTIYATDGCNSCRHVLEVRPDDATIEELSAVSTHTQLPSPMLSLLADVMRPGRVRQ